MISKEEATSIVAAYLSVQGLDEKEWSVDEYENLGWRFVQTVKRSNVGIVVSKDGRVGTYNQGMSSARAALEEMSRTG